MSWNLGANLAQHRFRPGLVEIFLQISIRVDFWLGSFRTRLIRVDSPTRKFLQVFLFFY